MFMSSTVQFFRTSPNLLPEKRPSTSPPRKPRANAARHFRNHRVRDIETEGVVDARQMIDADQHEGALGAEANGFLDDLGERSDQMRAIEFAGQRIVPRQFYELLVAGVAFVVDPDNALDAHRPAVGAGKPAAGLLDPLHGCGCIGPHAIFDPVRRAVAALGGGRGDQAHRSGPSAAARSGLKTPRRWPAARAEYREKRRRHARSRPGCRSRYPRQKRPGRARRGWLRPGEELGSRSPRFGTGYDLLVIAEANVRASNQASCAPTLCKVHKHSGNHVSFSVRNKTGRTGMTLARATVTEDEMSQNVTVQQGSRHPDAQRSNRAQSDRAPLRTPSRPERRWCRWRSPNGGRAGAGTAGRPTRSSSRI